MRHPASPPTPRRWRRTLAAMLLLPVLTAALYVGLATALMVWPVHPEERVSRGADVRDPVDGIKVEAYVSSNGAHTDFVFPIRSAAFDWSTVFPATDAAAVPRDAAFIAIGWGDREFYLHTPTWADLTASRALSAVAGLNPSLLHVTWLRRDQLPIHDGRTAGSYRLPLTAARYGHLVAYVRAKLPDAQTTVLPGAGYGAQDAFYEATGRYGPFETCNAWTGRGLREAGLTMGAWTPFDYNVVRHLDPVGR
jgi:uncharacterized protein (TIGR02117 family)